MNKEQFLNTQLNQISQVYFGKRNCCRCGCGGEYVYTSYMINPRTDKINDELVEQRLKRAKELVMKGEDVIYGNNYVDVRTGYNKTLTFYFDDLK